MTQLLSSYILRPNHLNSLSLDIILCKMDMIITYWCYSEGYMIYVKIPGTDLAHGSAQMCQLSYFTDEL